MNSQSTIDLLRQCWLAIVLGSVTLLLFVIEPVLPGAAALLEFKVNRFAGEQLPQLFSCHFLHWSGRHLFWDLGMFLVLCSMAERISRRGTSIVLIGSGILIPIAVSHFHIDVDSYRGLSGLDTALFGWVVVTFARRCWSKSDHVGAALAMALLLAMVAKTVHEITSGCIFVTDNSFDPIPVAHVVGGLFGIGCAAIRRL